MDDDDYKERLTAFLKLPIFRYGTPHWHEALAEVNDTIDASVQEKFQQMQEQWMMQYSYFANQTQELLSAQYQVIVYLSNLAIREMQYNEELMMIRKKLGLPKPELPIAKDFKFPDMPDYPYPGPGPWPPGDIYGPPAPPSKDTDIQK